VGGGVVWVGVGVFFWFGGFGFVGFGFGMVPTEHPFITFLLFFCRASQSLVGLVHDEHAALKDRSLG